jgi:hypothetical protein
VVRSTPGGNERHVGLGRDTWPPGAQSLDVVRGDDPATRVPEDVLEQDLDRDRRRVEVDPVGQPVQSVDGVAVVADLERGAGAGGVDRGLPRCHR